MEDEHVNEHANEPAGLSLVLAVDTGAPLDVVARQCLHHSPRGIAAVLFWAGLCAGRAISVLRQADHAAALVRGVVQCACAGGPDPDDAARQALVECTITALVAGPAGPAGQRRIDPDDARQLILGEGPADWRDRITPIGAAWLAAACAGAALPYRHAIQAGDGAVGGDADGGDADGGDAAIDAIARICARAADAAQIAIPGTDWTRAGLQQAIRSLP